MAHARFTWVIEGDVKACFDEISHKAILRCAREKVIDNKFLDLLSLLLKAGVEIDGVVHPTTKGVPQGGVVTPQTILPNFRFCFRLPCREPGFGPGMAGASGASQVARRAVV